MYNYLHFRDRQASHNQFTPSERDVIVMIRGLSRSYRTWLGLPEALSEKFDVICMDLPGVGLAKGEKPLYQVKKMAQKHIEVIQALKLSQVYIVAPSLGALVACEMAFGLPREQIGGLVLMSPSHSGIGFNRLTRQGLWQMYKAFSSSVEDRTQMAMKLLVGQTASGENPFELNPNLKTQWAEHMHIDSKELGTRGQLAQITAALGYTSRQALNYIRNAQIPTKVLIPTHDALIPVKHAHAFYQYIRHPQSAVIEMQNSGHDLLATHQDQLQDIITQFVLHKVSPRVYPIQPTPLSSKIQARKRTQTSLGLLTFGLVLLSWVFFRSSKE